MPKNTDGSLGPICNNCGGFGFTNNMTGGANSCLHCMGDGIQPVNIRELALKVEKILTLLEKINV